MNVWHIDTETALIEPGKQAPQLTSWQECQGTDTAVSVWHAVYPHRFGPGPRDIQSLHDHITSLLANPHARLTGHNMAFDMVVICAEFPDLVPAVFAAYEEGRIVCTLVRQKLIDIANGCYRGRHTGRKWFYALDECTARLCPGHPIPDKSNPWRTRFAELRALPINQWPREALDYAKGDARALQAIYWAQEAAGKDLLEDQFRQSAAAFWLRLASTWGVHTELAAVEEFHQKCMERHEKNRQELIDAGLVRPNGVRNTKAAGEWMEEACREAGMEIPRTPGGAPCLDEDSITQVGDPVLAKYQEFGSIKTLLSRIKRLRKGAEFPIQPSFDSLVETGRTSCSQGDMKPGEVPAAYGFQMQNPPTAPGIRECFVPRPGRWFLSVDYKTGELLTWAQVCLWAVGQSRMAEVLNAGRDPHNDLGAAIAGMSREDVDALTGEAKKKFKDGHRQSAKRANFGFPGGMGPETLRWIARTQTGIDIPPDEAVALRDAWRSNWPEASCYFQYVNNILNGADEATIVQFRSGRIRGAVGYCAVCNSFFSGLLADIAKEAGFLIAKACYAVPTSPLYGCRTWNFAHDEYLLEIPANPPEATVIARHVQEIMEAVERKWMPDLAPAAGTSAAVMAYRWSKGADTRIAKAGKWRGCLIPSDWQTEEG